MSQTARTFRLADEIGAGLSCDETGLYLDDTPLLARDAGQGWRSRPLDDLNAAGAASYGLPVDFAAKLAGLATVAAALDRGEIALAKIAALQLRLPDPPPFAKGPLAAEALARLADDLQASGVLAKDFDPDKHPRWPGGAPDHQGGRFAPAGEGGAPEAAPPTAVARKPRGHEGKQDDASPLATSLRRQPQKLSRQDQALLDTLEAKLKDPANTGVVTFDNRDDALRDMGYFFSADITRYDNRTDQFERGAWLFHDPKTGQWSYDRSEMQVASGSDSEVSLSLRGSQEISAYRAGEAISVHIHPLIWVRAPGRTNVTADNEANRTLSKPSSDGPGDAGDFAAFSRTNGAPLHAAVIGSDGSLSYWDGGDKVDDYEDEKRVEVSPRGTIPMLDPNH